MRIRLYPHQLITYCVLLIILGTLLFSQAGRAHVTAEECNAVHAACMSRVGPDLPGTQPPVVPEPETPPTTGPALTADAQCYLDRYKDVAAAAKVLQEKRGWSLANTANWHYTNWGEKEGRVWGCQATEPEPSPGSARRFHHYNPNSWDGRGSSVVACPGDNITAASIDGKSMQEHGGLDEGREVWTLYRDPRETGLLRVTINGKVYETRITDTGSMTKGDCWRG